MQICSDTYIRLERMFGAGGANTGSAQAQILSVDISLTCRGWIFEAASTRTDSESFSVFM